MRFIRNFKEELLTYGQDSTFHTVWPIYENPGRTELGKIDSWRERFELRGVIDFHDTNNIYIADISCLHETIIEAVKIDSKKAIRIQIFGNSKAVSVEGSISIAKNHRWLERYFSNYKFIRTLYT